MLAGLVLVLITTPIFCATIIVSDTFIAVISEPSLVVKATASFKLLPSKKKTFAETTIALAEFVFPNGCQLVDSLLQKKLIIDKGTWTIITNHI